MGRRRGYGCIRADVAGMLPRRPGLAAMRAASLAGIDATALPFPAASQAAYSTLSAAYSGCGVG